MLAFSSGLGLGEEALEVAKLADEAEERRVSTAELCVEDILKICCSKQGGTLIPLRVVRFDMCAEFRSREDSCKWMV